MRQGVNDMIIAAGDLAVIDERVHDRFFRRLHHPGENRIEQIVRNRFDRMREFVGIGDIRIRRRKRDEQIARTISGNATGAGQA